MTLRRHDGCSDHDDCGNSVSGASKKLYSYIRFTRCTNSSQIILPVAKATHLPVFQLKVEKHADFQKVVSLKPKIIYQSGRRRIFFLQDPRII